VKTTILDFLCFSSVHSVLKLLDFSIREECKTCTNTLMLSHSPGEIHNLRDQISQFIAVGDILSDSVGAKA